MAARSLFRIPGVHVLEHRTGPGPARTMSGSRPRHERISGRLPLKDLLPIAIHHFLRACGKRFYIRVRRILGYPCRDEV